MLTEPQVRRILDQLCVDFGFCLPREAIERIALDPPEGPSAFTDEVFRAEGQDPSAVDRHLYRRVRHVVALAVDEAIDVV